MQKAVDTPVRPQRNAFMQAGKKVVYLVQELNLVEVVMNMLYAMA